MCQHRRLGYTNEILYIDTVRMNMGESQLAWYDSYVVVQSIGIRSSELQWQMCEYPI